MSRPLRIQYPGAWYHVLNRGRHGEKVFLADDDYMDFIEVLADSTSLWKVNIAAFCLMSNHYHLLLQTPLGNLSRCMRHIDGVYTQRANRTHSGEGQVFRGRYKSILVDADAYILQLVRYIHRNPVTAGLVRSIDEYRWSSHQEYISSGTRFRWLYKDFILSQFGNTRARAVRSYLRFVANADASEIADFYSQRRQAPIMGDEAFIEHVRTELAGQIRHPEIPDSGELVPSVERITSAVCAEYGVPEKILYQETRGEKNEPRSVAIYCIRRLRGDLLLDIAERFGLSRHSSVSAHIRGIRAHSATDKRLRRILRSVAKRIGGASTAGLTPTTRRLS